jgi:hypothetical protein
MSIKTNIYVHGKLKGVRGKKRVRVHSENETELGGEGPY